MKRMLAVSLCLVTSSWAQGPITVFAPNGGETFAIGDTMHVRWEADSTAPMVMVEMSVDNGEYWYMANVSRLSITSEYWGDYPWVLADSLTDANGSTSIVSNQCMVRIRSYIDQITNDVSDAPFSIVTEITPDPPEDDDDDDGCGSGTGAALIPPLFFRVSRHWRKRRKNAST